MNPTFGTSVRCVSVGVALTLAAAFSTAQPSTPSPAELKAELPNKMPEWRVSPRGPNHYINSVAVSADGQRVVGGTFFDVYPNPKPRRGHPSNAPAVKLPASHDGTFGIYCYNAKGELQWKNEFQAEEGVYWVAISADGSRAAAGGRASASSSEPNGFVRAYDATNGKEMLQYGMPKMHRVNQVSLSGDGAWLVAGAEKVFLFRGGPTSYTNAPSEFTSPSGQSIVSVSISNDGRTVVYSDYGGWIGVLENNQGRLTPLAQWQVPKHSPEGNFCHMIDLAPNGKTFVAGGSGGEFYFFDVAKFVAAAANGPTLAYPTGIPGAVYGIAGAPDGTLFAGVVNAGDAGQAYAVPVTGGSPPAAPPLSLKRNPNSAAVNVTDGTIRLAIADGHPDGSPGHFYLFSSPVGTPGNPPLFRLRWIFQTGNMSWPIAISAQGNAVVGGSDDSHLYYFRP